MALREESGLGTRRGSYSSYGGDTPFSKKLRNFLGESRKKQMFYRSCEGAQDRIKLQGRSSLEKFVVNTMHFKESTSYGEGYKGTVGGVDKLVDKILLQSRIHQRNGDVHIFVIWIFYFEYDVKVLKSTPVFKIYMNETGGRAKFVDADMELYETWDHYLDTVAFPRSFLCVPRHGHYNFVGDRLDLEFLCSQRICHKRRGNFLPFCEVAILPYFDKLPNVSNSLLNYIKETMQILKKFWIEHKSVIINGVVVFACLVIPFFFSSVPEEGLTILNNIRFMILRTLEFKDVSHPLNHSILEEKKFTQEEEEALVALLKSPNRDWKKILKVVFALFCKNESHLIYLLKTFAPEWLHNLILFIKAISMCGKLLLNQCQIGDAENKGSNLRMLGPGSLNPKMGERSIGNVAYSSEPSMNAHEERELDWQTILGRMNFPDESTRKVVQDLCRRISFCDEESLYYNEVDGMAVIVKKDVTLEALHSFVNQIWGETDIFLYPTKDGFDVVLRGEELASIFLPLDDIVVCLCPKDKLARNAPIIFRS